jgi:hypothetical protein
MMGSKWAVADISLSRIGSTASSQDRGREFKSLHLHHFFNKSDAPFYSIEIGRQPKGATK